MSEIRKRTIEGLHAGDSFVVTRTFTEADTLRFGDLSRDYNPVHYDERFVEAKNLRGRICHGLLVGGMVTEIGGQIGWLASGLSFRFVRPVYFGDTVTCRLTIIRVDGQGRADAKAACTNQDGTVVLEASLSGRLPGPAERQVLKTMVAEGDPSNGCSVLGPATALADRPDPSPEPRSNPLRGRGGDVGKLRKPLMGWTERCGQGGDGRQAKPDGFAPAPPIEDAGTCR